MSVDSLSNQPPSLTQLNSINQTGDVALTMANLAGMTELMVITMITVSVSKVINDACSGPFAKLINDTQHQQYMDQAWESAINAAVSAAGSDADDSTVVNVPQTAILSDGSTSYAQQYVEANPNLASYFSEVDQQQAEPSDTLAAMARFSQATSMTVQDYYAWNDAIPWQINAYGDPSTLPTEPTSPPLPSDPNALIPPNYLSYANAIGALGISQLSNNPKFLYEDIYTVTVGDSKNLVADINASATNSMTALQQLTNTLNNLISAMATFCAAMAKCQQAVLKAPGS